MSKESPYDRGFKTRMGILCTILVIVGGLFAVDRFVMIPNADASIQKMKDAEFGKSTDHRPEIRKIAGVDPVKDFDVHVYHMEDYEFGRVLPFLAPRKATVVYRSNAVIEVVEGGLTEDDLIRYEFKERPADDPGGPPSMTMGGMGPSKASKKPAPDKEEEKDEEKDDEGKGDSEKQ